MDTKGELRQRAQMIIAYRATEVAVEEAAEIKRCVDTLPDGFGTPRHVKGALLPQCLGGRIKGRLSSYFAVLALLALAKKNPSLARTEELVTFAEECAKEELMFYFSGKAQQSSHANQPRPDALHSGILEILKNDHKQSAKAVQKALASHKGTYAKKARALGKKLSVNAFASRVTRARKELR